MTVFQDEVHFQVQTTVTRKWAPKGSEPKVMSKPGKESVSYSGFVIPQTGELIVNKPEWFNYETTIESIRYFLQTAPKLEEGKQYCIVMDNAPWHKKAIRLIWGESLPEYQDIRDKACYLRMPPYSPDLNPIEQVWRKTRREKTHNHYFADSHVLEDTVDSYFQGFKGLNEELRSLCSFSCFDGESVGR